MNTITRKDSLFHKPGFIYFWMLNDECHPQVMDKMLDSFAGADVAAVVLHARDGLRLPHGGDDWFDMIERTARRCAERGLQVWLYDEDPYPSGAAGGRVFFEKPQFAARGIERYEFDPNQVPEGEELFCFPTGNLLWCGLVNEQSGETIDYTSRVGTVRRKWDIMERWDSRGYYPDMPPFAHPRAKTKEPEYALRVDEEILKNLSSGRSGVSGAGVSPASFTTLASFRLAGETPALLDGAKLVAFVARPVGLGSVYGGLPDWLNPQATQYFIALIHERYRQSVGDMFGTNITAMFTDEPKFQCALPWTPGLFEDFKNQFGYELAPRLEDLFTESMDDRAILTRMNYRKWCAQRFQSGWLEPVAHWCNEHKLKLVGHISPEDDPVGQAKHVGNLLPLQRHFDLAGLDLITPAVGDKSHQLINVGILQATSAAAQLNKPGVMSESLGCSGLNPPAEQSRKILMWQTMMGMTTPVVHYAQNSTEGAREIDAPPDFGPFSPRWDSMQRIQKEIIDIQNIIRDSRQIAPVAVVWPIHSFWMYGPNSESQKPIQLRRQLTSLIVRLLDAQVGVHLIDEQTLIEASIKGAGLTAGRAKYSHLVIPPCLVLLKKTVEKLNKFADAGGVVLQAGQAPDRQLADDSIKSLDMKFHSLESAAHLPHLIEIKGDATDIRCTAWQRSGKTTRLLMNLRDETASICADSAAFKLEPGQVKVMTKVS